MMNKEKNDVKKSNSSLSCSKFSLMSLNIKQTIDYFSYLLIKEVYFFMGNSRKHHFVLLSPISGVTIK